MGSTGGEENVLCYERDNYRNEDIFLHEFSHGVHLLGAKYAISGFDSSLQYWYNDRRSRGLWANTYAMSTKEEYWAEGVQSWFNVNAYANPPNGIHNRGSTKEALRSYDYELYKLVASVFPCKNTFIKRCEKSRSKEMAQRLKMDCDRGDGDVDPDPEPEPDPDQCEDLHANCAAWRDAGYCSGSHEEYMSQNCKKSCNKCREEEKEREEEEEEEEDLPPVNCYDRDPKKCKKRVKKGHCTNPKKSSYMKQNCKKSCKLC